MGSARDPARDHSRCRRDAAPAPAHRSGQGQGPDLHRSVRRRRGSTRDRTRRRSRPGRGRLRDGAQARRQVREGPRPRTPCGEGGDRRRTQRFTRLGPALGGVAVRVAVRYRGPRRRHDVLPRVRTGQGGLRGRTEVTAGLVPAAPNAHASAAEVAAAWTDPKLANVLYHDWEAGTYDEKWSISFDQRCIDYARDRFAHVAGTRGWPYATALELGCGTGFFM